MQAKFLLGITMSAVSASAIGGNSVDVRLVGGNYEVEDASGDLEAEGGLGFNIKGHFPLNENVFFRANYLTAEPDEAEVNGQSVDGEAEGTFLRGGVGVGSGNENFRYYGALEYGDVELELRDSFGAISDEDDGFIVSGGLRDSGESAFLWEVELGLVQFDEVDGTAFEFALGYRINERIAILLSGQSYAVEADNVDREFTLSHGMLGGRIAF